MQYDKCLKCGTPKNDGDIECPKCGVIYEKAEKKYEEEIKKNEEKKKSEIIVCPVCNENFSRDHDICPNCGEPMSINAFKHEDKNNQIEIGKKTVSPLLIVGIVFMPYIFAWFTLRDEYSVKARNISFAWLGFLFILVSIDTNYSDTANNNIVTAMKDVKPSVACDYLTNIELSTRGWKNYYDDVYGCSSPYKEFGSGYPLKNNLAYYVDGTATTVTQLELVVNVNNRDEAIKAHRELLKASKVLTKKFLNKTLPNTIDKAIKNGNNMSSKIANANIEVIRNNWPTGKGYELKVIIK